MKPQPCSPPLPKLALTRSLPQSLNNPLHPDGRFPYNKSTTLAAQFSEFEKQLLYCKSKSECIRALVLRMASVTRNIKAKLLAPPLCGTGSDSEAAAVNQQSNYNDFLDLSDSLTRELKNLYYDLEKELGGPGEYLRYHECWRSETQQAVSVITFLEWLQTGQLLTRTEVEEKLGMRVLEYGLDMEDYIAGLCFMSNELVRYAVNQVSAGNKDCARKVLLSLAHMHASLQILDLPTDYLREKYNDMEKDLKTVQEMHCDLVQGLTDRDLVEKNGLNLSRKQ